MVLGPSRLRIAGGAAAPDVRLERLLNGERDLVYFGGSYGTDTSHEGETFSREAAALTQPRRWFVSSANDPKALGKRHTEYLGRAIEPPFERRFSETETGPRRISASAHGRPVKDVFARPSLC